MIKTILYPTDLGLHSALLLGHVAALAERYDAQIIVVHAVEPLGVFADAVLETYIPQDMIGDLRSFGMPAVMEAIRQQVIDAFEEEFIDLAVDRSRFKDVRVVRGSPAEVILEQQKLSDADIILMGAGSFDSGYYGSLGTTASKVLQRSPVPVYIVPVAHQRAWVEKGSNNLKHG